ncbi:outer membrane lipoprotein-sorting protein [Myxococcus sp. K15C18031901]|uniref:outer membrane lipoprotein-sorting protein n=1 Tax=Myxococcus dinghuensis TaxID=2906761 RepID=UPI0020A7AB55|nr:outer membrane lipoprotein-sorting protein [Myxococcus dinghuensis]MCP3102878.1 outer membrane lipoprotein-sorting protein [Myxococcus dinghuensis]
MREALLRAATAALLVLVATPALAAESAQELLARADAVRNPDRDFSVTTTLTEYRAGKRVDTSTLVVYSKFAADNAQYNSLIRYTQPRRDLGKLILRNGMEVWFYDPASKASVRVSPQARLLGQASNGDVMNTNLAKAYTAEAVGRETLEDDTKQKRTCVKLKLVAQRKDVAYARVDYWVDEENGRPLKAQFFTTEGRLLKTAFFRKFETALERERPTETVIIDGLDTQWITVMRASNFQWREIPKTWLQRDYLPRFRGEE